MKRVIIVILLLAAVGMLSAQSPFHAEKASLTLEVPGTAVAKWDAASHDFGQLPQGQPASHTFTFVNTGDKPLTIDKVKPGCGCTALNYSKEAIAPGEEGYVTATYNAAKAGFFTKSVTVFTNETVGQRQLVLKGEVVAKVE